MLFLVAQKVASDAVALQSRTPQILGEPVQKRGLPPHEVANEDFTREFRGKLGHVRKAQRGQGVEARQSLAAKRPARAEIACLSASARTPQNGQLVPLGNFALRLALKASGPVFAAAARNHDAHSSSTGGYPSAMPWGEALELVLPRVKTAKAAPLGEVSLGGGIDCDFVLEAPQKLPQRRRDCYAHFARTELSRGGFAWIRRCLNWCRPH